MLVKFTEDQKGQQYLSRRVIDAVRSVLGDSRRIKFKPSFIGDYNFAEMLSALDIENDLIYKDMVFKMLTKIESEELRRVFLLKVIYDYSNVELGKEFSESAYKGKRRWDKVKEIIKWN